MEDNPARIALKFEHVTVSFNDQPALDDVSFEVPAGDTRILFGAAGSGKTILLKTALGLLKPTSACAARSACCFRRARFLTP
jgi:ABC-type Mn2+/Zn2+ transport system ATPase subunit